MNLVDLIAFYGFHFNDYFSTLLALRVGAAEANPVLRPVAHSPLRFAAFKFGVASVIPLIVHIDPTLSPAVFYDTVIEALVTWWNTLVIWRGKRK